MWRGRPRPRPSTANQSSASKIGDYDSRGRGRPRHTLLIHTPTNSAGAKARMFCVPCGTTEVVPFRPSTVEEVGVLRLRRVMRFAPDPVALRMTEFAHGVNGRGRPSLHKLVLSGCGCGGRCGRATAGRWQFGRSDCFLSLVQGGHQGFSRYAADDRAYYVAQ